MFNPAILLAPVALLLPFAAANVPGGEANGLAPDAAELEAPALGSGEERPFRTQLDARQAAPENQVSIEQRVTVRITPRPPQSRQDLLAQLPRGEVATRLEERGMGRCVAIQRIAGVGTANNNRLILFLSDRRIVSAVLEKSCKPEDFYSGFYVERNDDGMLCVKRDKLQSRAGAKCGLNAFHQLVAVRDEE